MLVIPVGVERAAVSDESKHLANIRSVKDGGIRHHLIADQLNEERIFSKSLYNSWKYQTVLTTHLDICLFIATIPLNLKDPVQILALINVFRSCPLL